VELPRIPIGAAGEWAIAQLTSSLGSLLGAAGVMIVGMSHGVRIALLAVPPWLLIAAAASLAWWLAGRGLAAFGAVSLAAVWNLELWEATVVTFSLVATAALLSLLVALPLGVLMAERRGAARALGPVLDFLQTMPRFIYLIPAVIVFGIDTVGGVAATMTLAVPPAARLTALGIGRVEREVMEAGEAFGCTPWQLLWKIKLPLAMPSILLGVNQCIMMALSMVVIAAMIGAGGLGAVILTGIARLDAGLGFEAGLAVVILAILIDRTTKAFVTRQARRLGARATAF
jgi:ABC-type proline/glycine betaine transport system permease subunit